ncbi:MAG TPA: ATP-binding protein [Planctomycetota bacterium]|nr:ATP-binding protein [Planctomycetota bacterium]
MAATNTKNSRQDRLPRARAAWLVGAAALAVGVAYALVASRAHYLELAVVILAIVTAAGVAIVLLSRINKGLDRRVRERTRQLEESEGRLRDTLGQVEASERNLAAATTKVSELIDTAAREQALTTYYENPHLATCWKVRDCKNTWCPVHGREGVRCWQVEGTYCDRESAAPFTEKVLTCRTCEVFRRSCPDRLIELAEGFNNMMCLLARKAEELRHVRYQAIERERMATIGQMAAGIAHEISNPMASLFSLVQVLRVAPLDEQARGNVALMQSCIERVAKIVREIVDFGRPAAKEEWTHTSVERIVRDTAKLLRYDRRARKLDISVDFEPGLPDTLLIEHQLQQVFTNLMVNAFDAMAGQGNLAIRGRRNGEAIEVAITDTGKGMRPEEIRHIFEPFYTTKAGQKGTGLGLALSYSIMQRHGGAIRVGSEPGKGSTFTVSIPIRSAPDKGEEQNRQNGKTSAV